MRLDRILCISPLERADAGLVRAIDAAGALGVLDLGREPAARTLASVRAVRIPDDVHVDTLPPNVTTIITGDPRIVARWSSRRVLAQVTSVGEARAALAAGARELVAKGSESGG